MSSEEVSARDVELCQQGDRAALDRVLRRFSPDIEATIRRLLGWHADVEDVMQRAFVTAVKAFPTFRGDSSVKTWLVGIAVNSARDARRRRARLNGREAGVDDQYLSSFADPKGPERLAECRDLVQRASRHLDTLSDKLRETYVLNVLMGYSVRETAEALDIPELTVKSRVARARRHVAEALDADPDLARPADLRRADGT